MRSFSSFTPHYAEDVTMSISQLLAEGEESQSALSVLQALHPDEWENIIERVDLEASHTGSSLRQEDMLLDPGGTKAVVSVAPVLPSAGEPRSHDPRSSHAGRGATSVTPPRVSLAAAQRSAARTSAATSASSRSTTSGGASSDSPSLPLLEEGEEEGCTESTAAAAASASSLSSAPRGEAQQQQQQQRHVRREQEARKQGDFAGRGAQLSAAEKEVEIMRWAAERQQTLSRTVRGV